MICHFRVHSILATFLAQLLILAVQSIHTAPAQTANMLADINTALPGRQGSDPFSFVQLGGKVFFLANDGVSGDGLWTSDGTPEGTRLVQEGLSRGSLSAFRGKLVLFDWEGGLWVGEGKVDDLELIYLTGFVSDLGRPITELEGKLYFRADDGVNGPELWVTDGTLEGTLLVKDLLLPLESPWGIVNAAGRLYFTAEDGLWTSNGTPEETNRLCDFLGMPEVCAAGRPTKAGDRLFFSATDPQQGAGLWTSDGTPAGTQLVRSFGPDSYGPIRLIEVDGRIAFFVVLLEIQMWTSDGTPDGTIMEGESVNGGLAHLLAELGWSSGGIPAFCWDQGPGIESILFCYSPPIVVDDKRFFSANDGIHGVEPWTSDGTPEGAVMLKDLNPGSEGSFPSEFTAVGKTLFFSADDGIHGVEPWTSDGTPEGTVMIEDLNPGSEGSFPNGFTALGKTLFFSADDGTHGREPWAMPIPGYRTPFHRGDPNSSGTTDISDAISIFGFLFLGDPPAIPCKESADCNNDGKVDISDGIYLLQWLFTGGPEPVAPGPTGKPCGFDPDPTGLASDLGCDLYAQCQ